jgi:Ca2+-binding RTX toxin-like protein
MSDPTIVGTTVIQIATGFEQTVNSTDPVAQLNNLAQLVANVAALATSPSAALAVVNANGTAALVTAAKIELDLKDGKPIDVNDALNIAGNIIAIAAAAGVYLTPAGNAAKYLIIAARAIGGMQAFKYVTDRAHASSFTSAQTATLRRDPLTFDLDGDGIETVALSTTNPILFDINGDGVKTATGWVSPHDGFLVLDRNGNGNIDNGTELFGDATPLAAGGKAADGFAALALEDTNLDGKVDSADTRFASLRIWRDLNSDGISQTGELFTLTSLGIASINVTKTSNNTLLPNGNVIADLGTYTKTDGSTATLGDAAQLGDVNLQQDTFISQFTDPVAITPEAAALPNMYGSGQVRQLREAASISANLLTALTNYAAATTRETQQAQLDSLIKAWSDTSTMATTVTGAYAGHTLTVTFQDVTSGSPEYEAWLDKLTVLEHFNGRTFRQVATGSDPVTVSFSHAQMDLLDQAYSALKDSVYNDIILQTRLKPVIDQMSLTLDASGAHLDLGGVETALNARVTANAHDGLTDVLDFVRATQEQLPPQGWDAYGYLATVLRSLPDLTVVQDVLNAFHVQIDGTAGTTLNGVAGGNMLLGGGGDDTLKGNSGDDILLGEAGNDNLSGGNGNDLLNGGTGADTLYGQQGNDTLDGGAGDDVLYGDETYLGVVGNDILHGGEGNDSLYGGEGNDTYLFGRGEGRDVVNEWGGSDKIVLASGVLPTDVTLFRIGDDLILTIDQTATQMMTVRGFFHAATAQVETIEFANGTVWDIPTIQATVIAGTVNAMTGKAGNDTFVVDNIADTITEALNQGIDTVLSSVPYTLAPNIENLTLTGYLNINGTGNDLNNIITGNESDNVLDGMLGDDTLIGGAGNDTLIGGGGVSTMIGGVGDDTYDLRSGGGTATELANEGTDTVIADVSYTLLQNFENLRIQSNDVLKCTAIGNALDNVIEARSGDVIDGGVGADTMIFRNDLGHSIYYSPGSEIMGSTAYVDNPGDKVVGAGEDSRIISTIDWVLDSGTGMLEFAAGSAAVTGTGNAGNNTLRGNEQANVLYGLDGNDTLYSGQGADTLIGGRGDDTYYIHSGVYVSTIPFLDSPSSASPEDMAIELAGEGFDTVYSIYDYTLGDNIENLVLQKYTTNYGAGYAISGTGNALDNVITGNDANNVLDGLGGDDTLYGGRGYDTYVFGRGYGHDSIMDLSSAGYMDTISFKADISAADLILSRTPTPNYSDMDNLVIDIKDSNDQVTVDYHFYTYTPTGETPSAIEQFQFADGTLWNAAAIQARFNNNNANSATASNDTFVGTAAADTISTLDGADTVSGGIGDDQIDGGLGNDALFGNDGNDTLLGQGGDDWLYGNAGDDALWGGAGNDGLEGGTGNDYLAGGAGNDHLVGGLGNDTYLFGRGDGQDFISDQGGAVAEINTIAIAAGVLTTDILLSRQADDLVVKINGTTDQVTVFNHFAPFLAEPVQQITFADGTVWDSATIARMAQSIRGTDAADTLKGTADNDIMYGLGGNDTINGYAGNDFIDGGLGSDTMSGGLGDDTYIVDNTGDKITENANEGTDTVQSSVTYTLATNVENLTLTGSSAINGTGNTLNNVLTGNSGNNTLSGGTGADNMIGVLGDDIYVVDNTGDVVTENAGEGTDTVQSSVTYTLAANVENLTLTGTTAINGTGNGSNNVLAGNSAVNTLTGGAGDDTLNGGAGADTMVGGIGNDLYIVDNTGDKITENANEGMDTVQSSVTYTLATNVENLTLTGTTAINGTGNTLDNVLIGNSAANTLTGGTGNDTLNGAAGGDTMVGGTGDDTYVVDNTADKVSENANEGTDTVQSSITYTLGANAENLLLTGATAINGTDNTLNNLLTGNSANNTLTAGTGNDILQGGAGSDILKDTAGNNLLNGGIGTDTLTGAAGNEIFIGAAGNDTITTGTGYDILAFNRGDGQDTVVASTGADNTLSIGGGIRYSDLSFRKSANDLILDTGTGEQITLQGWYAATANKSVVNLQMIEEAAADFNASSTDPLLNNKIEQFNFAGLAGRFDQALAATPALTSWSLTNALLDFHIGESDTAALGGDLAYQYGKNGSLSTVGLTAAQGILGSAQFGSAPQALLPQASLQVGVALG